MQSCYLRVDQPALPANTTTVVQGDPRGTPECIPDDVLDRHVWKRKTCWGVMVTVPAALESGMMGDYNKRPYAIKIMS